MRAIARVLAMTCFLALGTAGRAWAQHPQTREGFWIGFGFGYGSLGFSCSGCSGTEGAPSGYLKLGGTLSPNLLIGGETDGWTKSISGTTLTAGNASLALAGDVDVSTALALADTYFSEIPGAPAPVPVQLASPAAAARCAR